LHTIEEAVYECHVETKELHDGFVYEQFEGANKGISEYGLPAVGHISIKTDSG
jgi:hypothetical protein